MAVYNFRFDRDNITEIIGRLNQSHVLCQGWGGGQLNLSLVQNERDAYIEKTRECYTYLASTRIPTNISRITNFKDGDLLVTPHLPEHRKVSIHVVNGNFPDCYDYLENDDWHLGHQIKIKRSYGMDSSISIYNELLVPWYARLPWLRLPILPIDETSDGFREIIKLQNISANSRFEATGLLDYLNGVFESALMEMMKKLSSISPNLSETSFEKTCEFLLKSQGYEIISRNQYDGEGGDIDLRCSRRRSQLSAFEDGDVTLLVQIKKHWGETDELAVKQLIKMMESEPKADGCVISLAERFSKEAVDLASAHMIKLIDGKMLCVLLLGQLGKCFLDDEIEPIPLD